MNFDLQLARQLAEFSRRAYSPAPCQGKVNQSVLLEDAATSTAVLVEDIGDAIVLAFRGTKELRDWLTDLSIAKTGLCVKCDPEKNCGCTVAEGPVKIHDGFLTALDAILPKIIACLLAPGADKTKLKPLYICGHSLGGALASLATFFLERQGFQILACHTFASPRVGNARFRAAYNESCGEKTFRVVCAGDLVPLIPGIFTPPSDGYRHVGREVFLDGAAHVEPSHLLELALDGWRAYRAVKMCDLDFILFAHSITDDYIPMLDRISMVTEGAPIFKPR